MIINRKDLITKIAEETGFTKKDITAVEAAFEKVIIQAMKDRDEVVLNSFLKFYTIDVPEKEGMTHIGNGAGKKWYKPAHVAPKIKMLKLLKESCAAVE